VLLEEKLLLSASVLPPRAQRIGLSFACVPARPFASQGFPSPSASHVPVPVCLLLFSVPLGVGPNPSALLNSLSTARAAVRLFVRDFSARFGAGTSFVVRKNLRFPFAGPGVGQASAHSEHLEEVWLTLVAKGGGRKASKGGSFKGGSFVSRGGSFRSGLAGSFKAGASEAEGELIVDGEVMRHQGRRWTRVPGHNLVDRLVTEVSPTPLFAEALCRKGAP
jgi:hypothetical protein